MVQTYKWFTIADSNGGKNAKNLQRLEGQMPPEKIAEAKRLAQEFVPHSEQISPDY